MKVGLVLEGGSLRALYSAGIMDVMLDHDIHIDGIIGVSAGALFGPNYFSKQKGRALRYNLRYCKDWRFISMASFLLTGDIVNKKFAYYDMTLKHDKFDEETFMNSNGSFYATATNIQTGKAEYLTFENIEKGLEVLRASAALPFFSSIVTIDNTPYLDGGISDPIPVKKMMELGYDKIIVILTQPKTYQKQQLEKFMLEVVKLKYRKYPEFIKQISTYHNDYNETLKWINELENNQDIFVFRPDVDLDIGTIERNPDRIQNIYHLGNKDGQKRISDLIEFLNK